MKHRFIELWEKHFDSRMAVLAHEGLELAILGPLAKQAPAGALRLLDDFSGSEMPVKRKAMATLIGLLGEGAPQAALEALFEREATRRREAKTPQAIAASQAVVLDAVLAATRWCRHPARKPAGLRLLRRVVDRSIEGPYWQGAGYALMGLFRWNEQDAARLLSQLGPIIEASRAQAGLGDCERRALDSMRAGDFEVVERVLQDTERRAEAIDWSMEGRDLLAGLLAAASCSGT